MLCDLDHFKAINDSRGHDADDLVLREVSQTLKSCMRDEDDLARWGGEEFLVVLPDKAAAGAVIVAERIRARIEALVRGTLAEPLQSSMTLGVAPHKPGESEEQTVARADAALYEGKGQGRNRVVIAQA